MLRTTCERKQAFSDLLYPCLYSARFRQVNPCPGVFKGKGTGQALADQVSFARRRPDSDQVLHGMSRANQAESRAKPRDPLEMRRPPDPIARHGGESRNTSKGGSCRPTIARSQRREESGQLTGWIKSVMKADDCGRTFDPGRVTIRRLNRAEYNNTIRDLIGIDFHPADDFPSDDVGYGFDNIGDVLSMPPILLEKYLAAAETDQRRSHRCGAVRQRHGQDLELVRRSAQTQAAQPGMMEHLSSRRRARSP